jgi:hypothetical protein
MNGFDWSPAPPFVPAEPGEDGWCVRDAICELLRWVRGSAEWSRFVQGPRGRDVPRLASHLGLTNFEFPGDWNEYIKRMAHPGVAVFDFPAYEKSHAVYVHDVRVVGPPLAQAWVAACVTSPASAAVVRLAARSSARGSPTGVGRRAG